MKNYFVVLFAVLFVGSVAASGQTKKFEISWEQKQLLDWDCKNNPQYCENLISSRSIKCPEQGIDIEEKIYDVEQLGQIGILLTATYSSNVESSVIFSSRTLCRYIPNRLNHLNNHILCSEPLGACFFYEGKKPTQEERNVCQDLAARFAKCDLKESSES